VITAAARFDDGPESRAFFSAESLRDGAHVADNGDLQLRFSGYIQRARRDDPAFWFLVANEKDQHSWHMTAARRAAISSALGVVSDGQAFIAGSASHHSFYLIRDGEMVIAASSGPALLARDRLSFLLQVLAENVLSVLFLPMMGVALVLFLSPQHIRRSLRSLSDRADSLFPAKDGARLDLVDAPMEIVPLVTAFNELLARNEVLSNRQRRFLSDAGHELRTPVTRARLHLGAFPPSEHRAKIALNLKWIGDIVSTLLVLARIDERPLPIAPHDVKKIVVQCIADHVPRAAEAGREFVFDAPDNPVVADCNPILVRIIIDNLLDNALIHGKANSPVTVTIAVDASDGLAISVANESAPGKSALNRDVEHPTSGLGLGLTLSQQAAAVFGATIALSDVGPNLTLATLRFSGSHRSVDGPRF
jgi:signal transduction histidine kinase